jgi:hypothetical protein
MPCAEGGGNAAQTVVMGQGEPEELFQNETGCFELKQPAPRPICDGQVQQQ